jgi:hypothetical protein
MKTPNSLRLILLYPISIFISSNTHTVYITRWVASAQIVNSTNPPKKIMMEKRRIRMVYSDCASANGCDVPESTVIPGLPRHQTNGRHKTYVPSWRMLLPQMQDVKQVRWLC